MSGRLLLFRGCALVAVLIVSAVVALGQSVTGSISGNVVDPSKQVVPGATVALVDEQTSAVRTMVSGDGGRFVFSAVQPGRYTVRVELTGFSTFERTNITLPASEQLSIGTIELQIGALSETVTTVAQGVLVQTESSVRSAMITDTQLETLAVRGRDPISMLRVLPGVSQIAESEALGGLFGSTTPNISGSRATWNTVTVDGVVGNDLGSPAVNSSTVNLDAVSEVRVQLNNYNAEYGRNGGSQVTLITKSGTQEFRGSLYGFKRHEKFNANNFFNNRDGIPKPLYRFTTVGATLGGPVPLPNAAARNKLFFFYSFENWDTLTPNPIRQVSMPTALERNGDFSQSRDFNGNLIVVRDPVTGQPFPNNQIPASRINGNGQALLNIYPLPNSTDRSITGGNYNYRFQESTDTPRRQHLVRADYRPSAKDSLYARYSRWYSDSKGHSVLTGDANWGLMEQHFTFVDHSAILNYTRVLNTSMVNEVSVGYRYSTEDSPAVHQEELDRLTRRAAGFTLGQFTPSINPMGLIPMTTFGSFIPNAAPINFERRFPNVGADIYYTVNDSLSFTRGNHTYKAGFYLERVRNLEGFSARQFSGQFDFSRDTSNPLDSGHPYANAMLGVFRAYTEQTSRPRGDGSAHTFEWFVQDSWKATPKLTADLGVRFNTYGHYRQNHAASSFSVERFDPAKAPLLYQPALVNGVRVARNPVNGQTGPAVQIGAFVPGTGDITNGMVLNDDPSYPASFKDAPSVLVEPRIGISYDLSGDSKTALRGSFGIFHNSRPSGGFSWDTANQPPVQLSPQIYYSTMDSLLQTTGVIFPSLSVIGFERETHTPTMYNFTAGVQRAVGWGTVIDVAYVGTRARQMTQGRNINTIPFGARFLPQNEDPTRPGNPLPDNFFRPYRGWGDVWIFDNSGTSQYDSMQVQANRRYGRGFQFGVAYTLSRSLDYTSLPENVAGNNSQLPIYQDPKQWVYGLSMYDATHVAVINYTWDLPRVSAFLDNHIVRAVFDNWTLSGISTFSSGNPAGIDFTTVDNADILGGGDPLRVCWDPIACTGSATGGVPIMVTGDPQLPRGERSLERWFDTSVFARPATGQIGNAKKDVIRLPGLNDTALTVAKRFPMGRARVLQFRWEVYNLFNQVQFQRVDTTARFDALGRQVNSRLGQVISARSPRVMQGSLRFTF